MTDYAMLIFDPVATLALAAVLSIVLLAGAWQKLREPVVFAAAIENYGLVPEGLANLLSRLLPMIELAAGIAILFPETGRLGGGLALALLTLVTGAVVINLWRGRSEIDCGCGGLSQQPLSWGLVCRNLALAAIAVLVMHGEVSRDLVWVDYLTLLGAVLALVGLYVSANQLMANAPRALPVRQ